MAFSRGHLLCVWFKVLSVHYRRTIRMLQQLAASASAHDEAPHASQSTMATDPAATPPDIDQAMADDGLAGAAVAAGEGAPLQLEPLREDQVANAVAFLYNPKVGALAHIRLYA